MSTRLVAVDVAARDVGGAEHAVAVLDDVLPSGLASYVASTHVVPGGRVAVAASWDDSDGADGADWSAAVVAALPGSHTTGDGAREAARQHRSRTAGRLARYAGRGSIERRLAVGEVVALSVVDEVRELGGGPVAASQVVDLREWARPTWQDGRVVLLVQRARDGLVPFESRHQVACCADH